ncbi:MAG: C4-type zinc ribbon domain-containing protein [Myxococcota bacterium]
MVDEILKLLQLQEVDGRIRAAREELATFDPQREEARAAVASERAAVEAAIDSHAEREQERRRLESELEDIERLLEKLDGQIYEVTSKQAMDAIQNEIQAARARKSDLEDEILEVLDQVESATSAREAAAAFEQDQAADRLRLEEARDTREVELGGGLEQLGEERTKRAAEVKAEPLRWYEDARRKAWPVLVHAVTKVCPMCRIVIPPQKWNEIRTVKKVVNCGSCHRILYGDQVGSHAS